MGMYGKRKAEAAMSRHWRIAIRKHRFGLGYAEVCSRGVDDLVAQGEHTRNGHPYAIMKTQT